MQIGGDFPLPSPDDISPGGFACREPFSALLQTGHLLFTDSGRSAIRLALQTLNLRRGAKVLVSAYICDTVIQAIRAEGHQAVSYPINSDLTASINSRQTEVDAALLVSYFGFFPHMHLAEKLSATAVPVIFDLTHAWLSSAVVSDVRQMAAKYGHVVIAGLRKLLPIPDGGMVWTPAHVPLATVSQASSIAPHADARIGAMLWKSLQTQHSQNDNGQYREAFLAAEEILDTQTRLYAMSEVSRTLLQLLDFAHMIETRRRNYRILFARSALWSKIAEPLFAFLPDGICPLGFPLLLRNMAARDALYDHLFAQRIYSMLLWPLRREISLQFPVARQLSMRLLTIPCDQRYDVSEMTAVADCIDSWCNQYR